ncbi:MAG: glycosyltransferase [Pseudomonadota bacterium]
MNLEEKKDTVQSIKKDIHVAIVVTFNRKYLLLECMKALLKQTLPCDIIIVDNLSTDGTSSYLHEKNILPNKKIYYLSLKENLGGSGGFYEGIKYAMEHHWECFWLMDDDAKPDKDALDNLLKNTDKKKALFASAAVGNIDGKKKLCWLIEAENKSKYIEWHDDLNEVEKVKYTPFLGFLIHRSAVNEIGLPVSDYFIYWDDKEYCERAKAFGYGLYVVKNSLIYHPVTSNEFIRILKWGIPYKSLPPWKVYYDVRNKIITSRKYYGASFWTHTIPGIVFRMFISIFKEKEVLEIMKAYSMALIDGFKNKRINRYLQ